MERVGVQTGPAVRRDQHVPRAGRTAPVGGSTDGLSPVDVGRLRRATGFALAATTRIRRATLDYERELAAPPEGDAPDSAAAEVIRRRVDTTWAMFDVNPANAALDQVQKHIDYFNYVSTEMRDTLAAFPDLPGFRVQTVMTIGAGAKAAFPKIPRANRAAPSQQELQALQDWRTDHLEVLIDLIQGLDREGEAMAAAANDEAADGQPDDEAQQWTDQEGKFNAAGDVELADLRKLIAALDEGSIYESKTVSIVGGYNGKPVANLANHSARIDGQAPVGKTFFNVQYQADGGSFGGVLFHEDDSEARIKQELVVATQTGVNRVSPSYTANRNAPTKKVVLSKKEKDARARQNRTKK